MANNIHFRSSPVAEGVRLEIGRQTVFAVRNEKRDISIRIRREPRRFVRTAMRIPLLRGIVRLFMVIYTFLDGLNECAELRPHRNVKTNAFERALARMLHVSVQSLAMFQSALLAPLILVTLLILAPAGAEIFLHSTFDLSRAWTNGIVCAVRIFGMLVSIWSVGRLRGFNRLLMYRCAINKTLNCCECNEEPTIETVACYPRYARKSEAAFVIIVLIITLALSCCVRTEHVLWRMLARIGILLGVAAAVHEPLHIIEEAEVTPFITLIRTPYDFFQYMTTLEPPIQVLEVAVCAFRAGLDLPETEEERN